MKSAYRKPYIYKVTNLETGQYYIGSQCSGKKIGVNYFTSSTNKVFEEGFKTYREEKYKIEIIREFEEFEDPEECVREENYMIRDHMLLKDGLCLNRACCCGGEKVFSMVGTHHTEETKRKMSESRKGLHRTEETRKKMSESHKGQTPGNKGTHHSEETRKKLSESHKGRPSQRRIRISIEDNTFNSITEAAKYYNMSINTIRNWLKINKHNAIYI